LARNTGVPPFDFDARVRDLAYFKLSIEDLHSKGSDLTRVLYEKYLEEYLELQGDREPQEFEQLVTDARSKLLKEMAQEIERRKMKPPIDWKSVADGQAEKIGAGDDLLKDYALANVRTCEDVIAGRDLYSEKKGPKTGARAVVNISSAHVPAFCEASRKKDLKRYKPYKNGYDLGRYHVGTGLPEQEPSSRETVDAALPLERTDARDIYFSAIELTGAGIRFYGDVCLVLDPSTIKFETVVLDRNSFDLISSPIREIVDAKLESQRPQTRKNEAAKLAGRWTDLGSMAALKVLQVLGPRTRRYTIGQIAEVVRHDEDYMEVLKEGTFGAAGLQEARISAADAAHDALTGDRTSTGPTPRLESLVWRHRRRVAEEELGREGVTVRVVTSSGRTRD